MIVAKVPQFSDMILDEQLKKEIEKQGANPEVLLFLMGWTGFIPPEVVDFMNKKYDESYLKKIKRKAIKDGGKSFWKEIKKECLKPRLKWQLQRGLFKMELKAPNPRNRPKKYLLWLTVHYFREYFSKETGKPRMALIAKILLPNKDYAYVNSEWNRRKKWFKENKSIHSIDDLLRFYEMHREKVTVALNTGVPIYKLIKEKIKQKQSPSPLPIQDDHTSRTGPKT